jgi:hypothetical protein
MAQSWAQWPMVLLQYFAWCIIGMNKSTWRVQISDMLHHLMQLFCKVHLHLAILY